MNWYLVTYLYAGYWSRKLVQAVSEEGACCAIERLKIGAEVRRVEEV